jgi:hypothetical protein
MKWGVKVLRDGRNSPPRRTVVTGFWTPHSGKQLWPKRSADVCEKKIESVRKVEKTTKLVK